MKRKLSVLLCMVLLFQCLPAFRAFAADETDAAVARTYDRTMVSREQAAVCDKPVNPYAEIAVRQPDEITASSAGLTLSGDGSTVTGTPYTFTVSSDASDISEYAIQIWHLEDGAFQTVYLSSSESETNQYVFYDTGSFCVWVSAYASSGETVGTDSVDVTVTAGEVGTTVAEKVADIIAECRDAATGEYDMALWLHDWLTQNANYDYDYSHYGADGVLMRGTGVCDSYSKAYMLLLGMLGIENQRITGFGNGGAHAWNLAKIEGNWCQIDCTWDDPGSGGYETHTYFGITDTMMARDHSWTAGDYPACTSLDNFYYYRLGYTLVGSDEEMTETLNGFAENKQETFKLCYIGEDSSYSVYSAFCQWFYTWNWKYGMTEFSFGDEDDEYIVTYGEPWEKPVDPDAADFTLYSPNGRYEFSQYNGNNGLLLVFGRTACSNTQAFLSRLSGSMPELRDSGVDVLVNLIDTTDPQGVWEMEALIPGYRYTYDNQSLMWTYLNLVGWNETVYFPVVFYISSEGKIVEYSQGYVNNMDDAIARALSLATGNPLPEPITHKDYSEYEQGTGSINALSDGTIVNAVKEAIQTDYVYLLIDYNDRSSSSNTPLAQYEANYHLYNMLGITMVASFADGTDNSELNPHVRYTSFNNADFWNLFQAAGYETSGSVSYSCAYLIDQSGTILKAANGDYLSLDEFAGYLATKLQYNSTIPASLTAIGQEAFSGDAFSSVDLENGSLDSIADHAFSACPQLSFVRIPETVTSIEDGAFSECGENFVIVCTVGSAAYNYACLNGHSYLCY